MDSVDAENNRRLTRRAALQRIGRAVAISGVGPIAIHSRLHAAERASKALEFRVSFPAVLRAESYTGRVYVFLSRSEREPRLVGENWFHPEPLLAKEVQNLRPGDEVVLSLGDAETLRDPLDWSSFDLSAFRAQAVLRFNPGERTVGDGPGNVSSEPVELRSAGATVPLTAKHTVPQPPTPEAPGCRLLSVPSPRLTQFYGRPVSVHGMVRVPASYGQAPERRYPVIFEVPGFGGTAAYGFRAQPVRELNSLGVEFIRVMLDPSCPLGHHVFADSANNGPWGTALVQDFLPALAAEYRTMEEPRGRLLTGHSSGGWSSLWLQVTRPEVFGGVWSTAPDPVDFRDFQRINIYRPGENMYVDSRGERRPIARRGDQVALWYDDFCRREDVLGPGGQLHSFEACFSPRGTDGAPQRLWDRATGNLDPAVAAAWTGYDIRLVLADRWRELSGSLRRKLHVHRGMIDTFYLDGATTLLRDALRELGSDAIVELHEGKDHGSLMSAELRTRMAEEMAQTVRTG
jgi:hypothetical protein